jgi:integrase
MRFPAKIKYRGQVRAKIYANEGGYRLYWRATVAGKRQSLFKSFRTYSEAKTEADKVVKQLYEGAAATTLTASHASDAVAALQRLQSLYQSTGRRISLLAGISAFCEATTKLGERPLNECVDTYLRNLATVKRVDMGQAIEQFIESRRLKTIPRAEGKRPEMSPEHHYNTALWLREFGATFPGYAVCDLTKAHLDKYMEGHADVGPKTRNERRSVAKMFLQWAVEKDYLAPAHRLFEAGGMKHEPADDVEIECYTAEELRALLERASKQPEPAKEGGKPEADYRHLLPVLALAGLAGMRFKEITRLAWEDVLGRPDHIEVKAAKSKTRSRRLIPTCPALAAWLKPFRGSTGRVWTKGYVALHEDFTAMRKSLGIPNRRNGMRHAFVSAHFAAHSDENLTAAQAGNSPSMIHAHYKGLLTKAEGEAWFCVTPAPAANVIPMKGATNG